LTEVGFEIESQHDTQAGVHDENQLPWYHGLDGSMSLEGFRMSRIGRFCTGSMVRVLETLRIAPAGSTRVSNFLSLTADDLVNAGKLKIFSPTYMIVARKP
jgi:sterol 24-C-methyltransferase